MRVDSLNNLNLHDSELLKVVIDTGDPSLVILYLNYIEDYEAVSTSHKRLIFHDCLKVLIDANFGLLTPDSLRTGHELQQSSNLDEVKAKLQHARIPVSDDLTHFYLETNSTGSMFNIIARWVELEDIPSSTEGVRNLK
jgi:hypothetical protein